MNAVRLLSRTCAAVGRHAISPPKSKSSTDSPPGPFYSEERGFTAETQRSQRRQEGGLTTDERRWTQIRPSPRLYLCLSVFICGSIPAFSFFLRNRCVSAV